MSRLAAAKITSFYGDKVARPYVLLDKEGQVSREARVDAPHANDALLEWAAKVPVKQGGSLVKPQWDGPAGELPKEPRNDFQIFFQERFDDVLAASPALFAHGMADRRDLLAAASVYWRETLTEEERAAYRERAAEEKKAHAAALAEAEARDPKFAAFRAKLSQYKASVKGMVAAARASAGPLWRAQRRMNKQYRLLEEAGAAQAGQEDAAEEGAVGRKRRGAGNSKAKAKGKKAGGGGARERLVDSDSSSASEDEGGYDSDAEAAADAAEAAAAEAMQKLQLATAKKAGKKAGRKAGGSAGKGRKAAAPAREEEEEEASSEEEQAAQRAGRGSRSGVSALAARKAAGSKGRKAQPYTDAFELPPSQGPTPAKAGKAGKAGKAASALTSPGKRSRSSRHAAVAAAEPVAEESPAKKQRRASARPARG